MSDYLLIHGGCHGAWCWQALCDELSSLGHRAFCFDLPGSGSDTTDRSTVTLDDYVDATNQFIEQHSLHDCILVGHSIAGMFLPAVASHQGNKPSQVVYLAALVTARGQRGIDMIPEDRRPGYYQAAEASVDNSISVDFETAWERFFNDLDKEHALRYFERLTPQPFAPYLDPARFDASSIDVPKRYIYCLKDRTFQPPQALAMAASAGIDAEPIDSDHCVMLSHPKELANSMSESPW